MEKAWDLVGLMGSRLERREELPNKIPKLNRKTNNKKANLTKHNTGKAREKENQKACPELSLE